MNSYRMLVTIVFFFSIMVSKSVALTSEDNFDDPNWTNSQWMIYELDTTTSPVWDFVPIASSYSGDLGYRADTFNYSQEDDIGPSSIFFQNGQEYETNNLTVSTLIRFDPPDINPYSSAVEGGIFLTVDPKNLYAIMLQVDYEPSAIEFDFGFGEIISGTSNYMIRRDLTGEMDYNIFYSLSVHIDSDGYFDFLLINYETGEELINIINFEPNTHLDEVSVGLFVGGKAVFNDFALTGNPVDQSYASGIVLTKNTPNHIITTGSNVQVYGTKTSNQVTLESGAGAELINFPGQNVIEILVASEGFTVSRSGTIVTFQDGKGTMLKIPATTDPQTIEFSDQDPLTLSIHNGQVMLNDQVVTIAPSSIDFTLEYPINIFGVGNFWKYQISPSTSTIEANMTVIGETNIFGVDGVAIIEISIGSETQIDYKKMIDGSVFTYNYNGQTSAIEDVYYHFRSGPVGTSWSVIENTGIEQYEIVAIEDVQVPAGVFSRCYKVANSKINPSDGSLMSYDERWWHPGTGYVKMIEHIGLADQQQFVLIDYNISQ